MKIQFQIHEIKNLSNNLLLFSLNSPHAVEVIDTQNSGIIIQTLGVVSARGQLLNLTGEIEFPPLPVEFTAAGEIIEYAEIAPKSAIMHFRFHQFNKVIWNKYLELLSEAQGRLDRVFKSVKGDFP